MNSILGNGIAFLAARLFIPATSFAINVAIARLWGKETLGAYVHLFSLVLIFQTAAGAGISALLTRELSARMSDTRLLVRLGRSLGLLTGLGATLLYGGVIAALLPQDRWLAAAVLGSTILPAAWIAVHEAYFQASRSHHRITLIAVVENVVKLLLAAIAFAGGFGLTAICFSIAAGRIVGVALGAYLVRREGCARAWRPRWQGLSELARPLISFAAIAAVSITYYRSDILAVEQLLGSGSTGIYGAAVILYSVMLMLPEAAVAALYPRLARVHGEAPDGFRKATEFGSRMLPLFMAPFALALSLSSGMLVRGLYGAELAGAEPLLRILTAALPIHAYNAILGAAMQAAHLQRLALWLVSGTLAVQFLLLSVLIERFGVNGAPAASILSALTLSASMTFVLRRRVGRAAVGSTGLLSLSWAITPLIACILLQGEHPVASLGIGLVAIASGLWLLGLLSPSRYRDAFSSLNDPVAGTSAAEVGAS